MGRRTYLRTFAVAAASAFTFICSAALAWDEASINAFDKLSPMGKRAAIAVARIAERQNAAAGIRAGTESFRVDGSLCLNEPRCPRGLRESAPGGQAELSIAVDETGQHIVIGFNDTRGFASNPISVSGYMYSEDGGETFVDGGQLPSPGNEAIGATLLPQVFGDPEVKYLGDCVFIYASILVKKFSDTTAVQTMGVHRSSDCGKTWTGPFEVTAATNPNGLLAEGEPLDAADKEFMDVDPETGRVMMSWSNFTPAAPGGVEIRTAFTDNMKAGAPPAWSAGTVVSAMPADGQASIPRFAPSSPNAYVAWRRFPFPGTFFGFGNSVGFARSLDNGATWQAPIETSAEFFTMDQVLGNDRINTSPSLAVDHSHGPRRGTIYLTYARNDGDGADVVIQRSTNGGRSFSSPQRLNAAPLDDRAQWFPWVTVDSFTGRVHVFYYDQGIDDTGDLSEVSYVHSDNGGQSWSAPVPLTRRPFRAGWGNDTGQPNLGDYNQAVAQRGELFAAFAVTARPPAGFVDGQPTLNMTVPDIEFRRVSQFKLTDLNTLPLGIDVNAAGFSDSGGNSAIDPGETVRLRLPLENYTLNPLSRRNAQNITALLISDTPGVQAIQPIGLYGSIASGDTRGTIVPYRLRIAPGFDPGTLINLRLIVAGQFGSQQITAAELRHTLFTGTPLETTLLAENFDGVAPGTLPAGWTAAHGAGLNVVPWTTTGANTFCGNATNAAFHQNADDNPGGNPSRWERLFSPNIPVPADSDYVSVEFDVCTDTEDDPNFTVQAYDGLFLRVLDATPGHTLRSVLVEAFADVFTTGSSKHYPKHLPRSGNPRYFEDMSVWAGRSGGSRRVRLKLPGMAGTIAQLRFEYTQDSFGICTDVGGGPVCGVSVDNITVKSVRAIPQP